ncbi:MAG: tetratricopeptide repeat protein [Bacteroidia bacterium]|nr:tetratricopeptide repeat protein [Bacteroidia bacterium]
MKTLRYLTFILLFQNSGLELLFAQDISSTQDIALNGSSFDFPDIISKAKKSLSGISVTTLELKLKNAEQNNDFKEAASVASNIGLLFLADQNYEGAIQNFQVSIKYREKAVDKKNFGLIYGLIGYTDFLSGNFLQSDKNFKKGLALMNENRIGKGIAIMDIYLGHVHNAMNDWNAAQIYYLTAAKEYVSIGDKKSEAFCENKAGEMFLKSNDEESALEYFQNARLGYESVKDSDGKAIALRNIGILYYKRGEYESALDYFTSSAAANYQLNVLRLVRDCYLKLLSYYSSKKNIDKANEYNELYNQLRDSIMRMEKGRPLKNDELKIQSVEKGNIIQMLNAKTRQQYELLSKQEIEMKRLTTEAEIERLQKEKALEALNREKIQSEETQLLREDEIERLQKEKVLQDLALSKKELELNRQENQRNILIAASLLVLMFALFFFNRYRLKKRSHNELGKAYSELKQTHKKLQTLQQQLVQQEKLASLGQLTAGIAHEIQNPLNFIINFTQLSVEMVDEIAFAKTDEERTAFFEEMKINLGKIGYHGKRADSIVRNMLEHSRTGKGEIQRVDMNKFCDEYLNLAYHGIRATNPEFHCELKREFSADLPLVKIMPQDFSRVLLNLFNNAFYSVNERGQEQETNDKEWNPSVSVSTIHTADEIILVIRDNGTGIPAEVKQKIFEPFFTTKPSGQGTGLGLSISSDIIKAHGGKIKVTDNTEGGSSFTITLLV